MKVVKKKKKRKKNEGSVSLSSLEEHCRCSFVVTLGTPKNLMVTLFLWWCLSCLICNLHHCFFFFLKLL